MALETIGTLRGATHVSLPAVRGRLIRPHGPPQGAAATPPHGTRPKGLIDDALGKPLYAAGNMPTAR